MRALDRILGRRGTQPTAKAAEGTGMWGNVTERLSAEAKAAGPGSPRFGSPASPIGRLPDEARRILDDLRERADDAVHLVRAASDEMQEAIGDKRAVELRIRQLLDGSWGGGAAVAEDHPAVVSEREKLERIEERLGKIRERHDARSFRFTQLRQLVDHLESWLARLPSDAVLEPHAGAVKVAKSASIESIRERLGHLRADRHQVLSAPIRSDDAKAIARREIEALSQRGTPYVFGIVERAGNISWPSLTTKADLWGHVNVGSEKPELRGWAAGKAPDTLALFAWLHRDQLLQAIEREIDAAADDPAALSDEARAERLAEIDAQILAAERQEAVLVQQAGPDTFYRVDSDPRALLNLSGDLPGPRDQ